MMAARRGRALVAMFGVLAMLLLTGCGGSDSTDAPTASEPRGLTEQQAELLAFTRFRTFAVGLRRISVEIPAEPVTGTPGGRIEGWVDFAAHVGYAAVTQESTALGVMAWDGERMAVNELVTDPEPSSIPTSGWRSDRFDPASSSMAQSLAIVLSLGSDRPENPLLLRQSDAAFLRTDTIGPDRVSVIVGPSSGGGPTATPQPVDERIRYWIDGDGQLRRVQVKLRGGSEWTVIDLLASQDALAVERLGDALR